VNLKVTSSKRNLTKLTMGKFALETTRSSIVKALLAALVLTASVSAFAQDHGGAPAAPAAAPAASTGGDDAAKKEMCKKEAGGKEKGKKFDACMKKK
jgi:hypothetical protein